MYIMGVSPDRRTTEAELAVGTTAGTEDGRIWTYVQANADVRANNIVRITETFTVRGLTTSNDYPGVPVGGTTAAFQNNEYGWVLRCGVGRAEVNGAVAQAGVAAATGEHGRITDEGTPHIQGIFFPEAINDNATGTIVLTWPHVNVD